MGIRETQPYGLPSEAKRFLLRNAKIKNYCKHCKRSDGFVSKRIGDYGMFDELILCEYTLKDGSKAQEFVQHEEWSSGPMIFLALKTKNKVFKWKEKDIRREME